MIDMGILRVEVIGAKNLMAGDRSGKSDVCLSLLIPDFNDELTCSLMSLSTLMVPECSSRRLRRSE
jgi:hypothetical protein